MVTVLFADLVGFTALSEHRDPEAVKRVVDSAFERLVADVTAFGGRVDKIVGDAIVALFGAPVAHEDDAERAVRAGLRMHETLADYGRESGVDIRMRVGVNTGEVLVGALRAGGDYTAMGDVVNVASRLQTSAAPGEVVVGETTHRATAEAIDYESHGTLTPRGRERDERVWVARRALRPPGRDRRFASTPLVGRSVELSLMLGSSTVSMGHSRGQITLLVGEAGVGKTRLAEEFAQVMSAEHGVPTCAGRCLPYGEVNPWWPIAEILREVCGIESDATLDRALPSTRSAVEAVMCDDPDHLQQSVVDGLLHMMGYEGPLRGLDGAAARKEAGSALLAFLDAALRHSPLALRIADLHWADDAVLELIDELATKLARRPLVFVATARPSIQDRWHPPTGRFNTLSLSIDPLDREAVDELLDHLSPVPLDQSGRSELLDRSGGNPLYLEELVALLDRTGRSIDHLESSELPETLRGLLAARIDALSPEEQAVIGDAAVWGDSGSLSVLDRIALAARGVESVSAEVHDLVEDDVLVLEGSRWSFRSDLLREVAYTRLTKSDRLRAHLGIASYLDHAVAGSEPDDVVVETIARHYVEAALLAEELEGSSSRLEIVPHAVSWVTEAARRAERNGSWPLANRLHGRILELVGELDQEVRVEALLGRSRVQAEQWRYDGALADARAALRLSSELGLDEKRAEALLRVGGAEMRRGEWDAAGDAFEEALEIYGSLGDEAGRGEVLREQGLGELLRGDHRAAEQPIRGALEAFRAVRDRRGEGWALQSLAWIALGDGRAEAAAELVEASSAAFTEVGDRGGLEWTMGISAFVHLLMGDFDTAVELAKHVLAEAERRDDRFGIPMMHIVLGSVELWNGHPSAAALSAGHALEMFQDGGADTVGREQALGLLGRCLVMMGDVERGLEHLREALRIARDSSTRFGTMIAELTEIQLGLPRLLFDPDELAPDPDDTGSVLGALWWLLDGDLGRAELEWQGAEPGTFTAERAAAAVVSAALGDRDRALSDCELVLTSARGTYADRVLGHLVRSLLDLGAAGAEELAAARAELEPTEDTIWPAMLDLAEAVRAGAHGVGSSTSLDAALDELDSMGLAETRWTVLFDRLARGAR